jgi:hypothetical protein
MSRPEIIERTYNSFNKSFNLKDYNLILNIDPIPGVSQKENDERAEQCHKTACSYFNSVDYSYGFGNFSMALKTVWEKAAKQKIKYVFHLEDDWELTEKISMNDLVSEIQSHPMYFQVCLRAYFMQTKSSSGYCFCLTPSLIKRRAIRSFFPVLTDNSNPEETIRKSCRRDTNYASSYASGYVRPFPADRIVLKDIGTEWRNKNNITFDNMYAGNWNSWVKQK